MSETLNSFQAMKVVEDFIDHALSDHEDLKKAEYTVEEEYRGDVFIQVEFTDKFSPSSSLLFKVGKEGENDLHINIYEDNWEQVKWWDTSLVHFWKCFLNWR